MGAGALRVYVESEESVEETPVLVVVRHEKGVLSWQLPLMLQVQTRQIFLYLSAMLLTQMSRDSFLWRPGFGLSYYSKIPGTGTVPSVSDLDSDWIRIQSGHWIRIRIQEGKSDSQ